MKKLKLLLALVVLYAPIAAFAQPSVSKALPVDIKLGIKGGLNFARLNGDAWTAGSKTGFHAGAFASVGVKKIGGQIEAIYSQNTYNVRGAKLAATPTLLKDPANDSTRTGDLGVSYINIPILLNLNLFGNAVIQLGPQYSGVLSVNDKDNILNDPDGFFNNSDVSGVVGIWLNLPFKLNAGARYIFGFSDQNFSSIGESWKRRNIQIHVGYSFL